MNLSFYSKDSLKQVHQQNSVREKGDAIDHTDVQHGFRCTAHF